MPVDAIINCTIVMFTLVHMPVDAIINCTIVMLTLVHMPVDAIINCTIVMLTLVHMPVDAIINCTIVMLTLVPSVMYLREMKQARDAYVCADNGAGVCGMTFILYYMLRLVASATQVGWAGVGGSVH